MLRTLMSQTKHLRSASSISALSLTPECCVHNGSEAMNIFPEIQQKARKALLEYCCLDTFAMVKLWRRLCEVVE